MYGDSMSASARSRPCQFISEMRKDNIQFVVPFIIIIIIEILLWTQIHFVAHMRVSVGRAIPQNQF